MTEHLIRHAVVTGANGGIGSALVHRLVAEGTAVVAIVRDATSPATVADVAGPGSVRAIAADLASSADVERAGGMLAAELSEVDLLVHAAGTFTRSPLATSTVADFDRQLAVNLRAPYLLTRLLLPALERARGHVVFVNSSVASGAHPGIGGYAASKAALRALADSIRAEVNPLGIGVLSLYPGRTDTPLQEAIHRQEGREYDSRRLLAADDVAEALLHAVRMPRTAEVTEIALRPMRPPA